MVQMKELYPLLMNSFLINWASKIQNYWFVMCFYFHIHFLFLVFSTIYFLFLIDFHLISVGISVSSV